MGFSDQRSYGSRGGDYGRGYENPNRPSSSGSGGHNEQRGQWSSRSSGYDDYSRGLEGGSYGNGGGGGDDYRSRGYEGGGHNNRSRGYGGRDDRRYGGRDDRGDRGGDGGGRGGGRFGGGGGHTGGRGASSPGVGTVTGSGYETLADPVADPRLQDERACAKLAL
ncbi:hypothetical protein PRIC1_010628 [Phytophthora ramorum]